MSNYYTKQDAKRVLCEQLQNRGWEIFGYKADESDSMTDYFSPSSWSGIATKNGYTMVIDDKYASNSNREITVYNKDYKYMSNNDSVKIEALKNMTQEKGATEGEENNAKALIEKLSSKFETQTESQYQVIGNFPTYMGNSKGSIWHIEKDGCLVDKGNSLTVFADVPASYMFDIATMEYKEAYKDCKNYNYTTGETVYIKRELNEDEAKAVKKLKVFILRVERAVSGCNSCGDGTKETEEAGQEQQNNETMEKVTEKVVKNVIKLVEVERENSLNIGDIFWQNGSGNLKVIEVTEKYYSVVKLGRESRGYQESKANGSHLRYNCKSIDRAVTLGESFKIYVLKEVEEITEVEKWVKVSNKKSHTTRTAPITPQAKKETQDTIIVNETIEASEVTQTTNNNNHNQNVKVVLNKKLNGVEIYFNEKPEIEIRKDMKANSFHWGGYKNNYWYAKQSDNTLNFAYQLELQLNKADILKEDASMTLEDENNLFNSTVEHETESIAPNDPYAQDKIEEGYIYSCHFKEWETPVKELRNQLLSLGIKESNIIDYGCKIGIENANYNLMLAIEIINNKNGGVLFIDSKIKIDDIKNKVPA